MPISCGWLWQLSRYLDPSARDYNASYTLCSHTRSISRSQKPEELFVRLRKCPLSSSPTCNDTDGRNIARPWSSALSHPFLHVISTPKQFGHGYHTITRATDWWPNRKTISNWNIRKKPDQTEKINHRTHKLKIPQKKKPITISGTNTTAAVVNKKNIFIQF